ncbi:MAG TPA: hypothetical protein VGP36_25900 [Mycobacteriales bacterium]|jgi:hypothetical protein|nr:hypothetical protein [Mycobacteriales bacterium]
MSTRTIDYRDPVLEHRGPALALAPLRGAKARSWLRRKAVGAWMNVLIALAAGATVCTAGFLAQQRWPDPQTWAGGALKLFALWCLAFLPGWLYVRFLGTRARALWNEYVLTLHRLGCDRPWHLPEPPPGSDFHARWEVGPHGAGTTIYEQKFEAYYGRQPSEAQQSDDYVVSSESLFPVFLSTAILGVGWSAVLWDTTFLTAPDGVWDVLKYAFLGAYAFVSGMLVRRYFQSDLRPSAYASAVFRIILVLLLVAVLHQVLHAVAPQAGSAEFAVAFVVGFFPLVGLQVLQRVTARVLQQVVPPVASAYPLDHLDGLNLWYEARLIEEGVENMQNLTTMNLVDVILHTRVPPGRLIDWIDQAFLLLHLGADKSDGGEETGRAELRRVGVRTATDLLTVFSVEVPSACGGRPGRRYRHPAGVRELPLPADQLRLLVGVLAAGPGLDAVWNWQRNGRTDQFCP